MQKIKRYFSAKKIAVTALLTALSLIVFMVENLLPPLFIPGAKPGLSNLFTTLAILLYSPVEGLVVVIVRTFLGSVVTGNLFSLTFSMTAGVVSAIISGILLTYAKKLSLLTVSVIAAVAHNIVQAAVYTAITATPQTLVYAPYLALCGVLSGAITGAIALLLVKAIPQNTFEKLLYRANEK